MRNRWEEGRGSRWAYPRMRVKLWNNAKMPTRGTPQSAGLDLYATEEVIIQPGDICTVSTALAVEIPEGWCGLLMARSSMGTRGVMVSSGVSLIDSDYRGVVYVPLTNYGQYEYIIHRGDRIAQLLITNALMVECVAVDELSQTQRGNGGFGSTGV